MGLFGRSKKKSNSEKKEGNKEKVTKKHEDFISELGLIEYKDGHLSKIVESKDKLEVYNRFGFWGVIIHSMMCAHFKSMDYVSQYFKEGEDKRPNVIDSARTNPYPHYKYSDLSNLMSDRKLSKSTDVTRNLDSFVKRLNDGGTTYYSSHGFYFELNSSNIRKYDFLGKSKGQEFITYKNDGSGSLGEVFKYLLDLEDISEFNKISKEIVGFNYSYLLNPLCYCNLDSNNIDGTDISVHSDSYFGNTGMNHIYSKKRKLDLDQRLSLSKWKSNYDTTYKKTIVKFINDFVNLKMESLNTDKVIFNLKKRSFELLKNDKEKSLHFSKIYSHIFNVKDFILSQTHLVEKIYVWRHEFGTNYHIPKYGGFLTPKVELFLFMDFINSKFFELETIINICGLMIETLEDKDEFSYSELYTVIEPFHVFDKTIEKEMLKNLENIFDELKKVNSNLEKINESIVSGFNSVISQLEGVNNKLYFNNLLGVINTYQLHRISKK
jgi:hypothetical protein